MFKFKSNPLYAPNGAATGAKATQSEPVVNPPSQSAGAKAPAKTPQTAAAKAVKPKVAKAPRVHVLGPAPAIAKANPNAKPTRANMFYISAMVAHGGVGHRKDRWHQYYPGLSLFDCQLIDGLDHTQLAYYANVAKTVTLTPYTDDQVAKIKAAVADGTYKPNTRPAGFKTKWGPNAPAHLAVMGQ